MNNTQTRNSTTSVSSANFPALICPNYILAFKVGLTKCFDLVQHQDLFDSYIDNPDKEYYILADKNTPEHIIKRMCWFLVQKGISVKLYFPKLSIDDFISHESTNFTEITKQIIDYSISFEKWNRNLNYERITIDNALDIAKVVIRSTLSNTEKNQELVRLRKRCNEPHNSWSNLIMDLWNEFNEECKSNGFDLLDTDYQAKKLELQFIAQETDTIKQKDLVVRFRQKYKWSDKLIWEEIQNIRNQNSNCKARRLKINELHKIKTPDNKYIFPGLLPSVGVTISSALSGVGKTMLAFDCAASLLFNQEFLGQKPLIENGNVLFVNSKAEMLIDQLQTAFLDRGIYGENINAEVINDWDITQIDILEDAIKDVKPHLIEIDSFRGITATTTFDENSKEAGLPVRQLQALAEKYQLAILLIHHDRKSDDSTNKVSKSAGNVSITASASCVWNLSRNRDDTLNFKISKIRNDEGLELTIKLNPNNDNRFDVLENIHTSNPNNTIDKNTEQLIIDVLTKYKNDWLTVKFISEQIDKGESCTQKNLRQLVKKSLVLKTRDKSEGKKYNKMIYRLDIKIEKPDNQNPSVETTANISDSAFGQRSDNQNESNRSPNDETHTEQELGRSDKENKKTDNQNHTTDTENIYDTENNVSTENNNISEIESKILDYMARNEEINPTSLANDVGIKFTKVREILITMADKKLINSFDKNELILYSSNLLIQ